MFIQSYQYMFLRDFQVLEKKKTTRHCIDTEAVFPAQYKTFSDKCEIERFKESFLGPEKCRWYLKLPCFEKTFLLCPGPL